MKSISRQSRIGSVRILRIKLFFILLCFGLVSGSLLPQTPVINELMNRNASLVPDLDGHFHDWIELYNPELQPVRLEGYHLSDDPDRPDKWTFPEFELEGRSFTYVCASDEDSRENTAFETVVNRGDLWKYQTGSALVSRSWYLANFNDASWSEGPGGLGFGNGADSTAVSPAPSLFARRTFALSGADSITRAVLHIDYEDGFVAYINGREVARKNIGNTGDHPAWDRRATASCEARIRRGKPPEGFEITNTARLFREGKNVLAIQVHAARADADDLTLIPFLTVGKPASKGSFRVPEGLPLFVAPFDANFKIKAGETLVFSDSAGTVLDSVSVPSLPFSVSAGRFPDGKDAWRWMSSPTPGSGNRQPFVAGVTPSPLFDPPGGLFSGGRVVTVSSGSAGDSVRVTTDGSDPLESSPPLRNPISMKATGVLRGRAFRTGWLPSPIVTQTYLIREQRELPIVSLATDPSNLWDENTGIYVMGPNASPENPYFGANFWQDWERPVHVDFFETGGSPAFSLDAGIKIYGAWSRAWDQRSFALYFRNEYDTLEIDHRLFPNLPIRRFQTFILRNSGNDWQYTMFRDGLMQTLVQDRTRIDVLAYRPSAVFLNGEYWGLLNLREKPDAHYLASHHGVDPDDLDLLSYDGGSEPTVIDGRADSYKAMTGALAGMDMSTKEAYAFVHARIDLDNYMDYMTAQIYYDNTDWPGNNIKFWKSRTPGAKWRWILYDTDFGFGLYDGNGVAHNTLAFALDPAGPGWPNPPASTFLFRKLVENPVFRNRFINRAADHLNSTFDKNRVLNVIDSLSSAIASEIPLHRDRWPGSAQNWESRLDLLRDFAGRRVSNMRSHFVSRLRLSGTVQFVLNVSDKTAGGIRVNSLNLSAFPWTGTYFKGVPVEVAALPKPGYRFAGWSDPGLADSVAVSVCPAKSLYLTARFEPDTGGRSVVINEINYHSSDAFDPGDWAEVVNPSDASVDLSGWSFRAGSGNPPFVFQEGSFLSARRYAVLAADTVAFNLLFPDVPDGVIGIPFNFRNAGDSLVLTDRNGNVIDSIAFGDGNPWPAEADGSGFTLALGNPESDNADPSSWSSSRFAGGTPGRPNAFVVPVRDRESAVPAEFKLYDNFPNPFNASTTIRWDVPARSRLTVAVFDLRGRRLRTVAEGETKPGKYSFRWDAPVPSGVYIIRIIAVWDGKRFEFSRKMACIK
jgi:hypothetical protein